MLVSGGNDDFRKAVAITGFESAYRILKSTTKFRNYFENITHWQPEIICRYRGEMEVEITSDFALSCLDANLAIKKIMDTDNG